MLTPASQDHGIKLDVVVVVVVKVGMTVFRGAVKTPQKSKMESFAAIVTG